MLAVRLAGQTLNYDVGVKGLTIKGMNVDPTSLRTLMLEVDTPAQGGRWVRGNGLA